MAKPGHARKPVQGMCHVSLNQKLRNQKAPEKSKADAKATRDIEPNVGWLKTRG